MLKTALFTNGIPPRIEEVKIYFNQKGLPEPEAEAFFMHYEKRLWVNRKGNPYKEWKTVARREISSLLKEQPWLFNRAIN